MQNKPSNDQRKSIYYRLRRSDPHERLSARLRHFSFGAAVFFVVAAAGIVTHSLYNIQIKQGATFRQYAAQQQLLDTSPDSRKKLGYVILFSAVFVLAMLMIAFAGRNAQNKMQPVCQEALEALTQRDAERWQSCLHPTKAADELRDMDAFLSELGIPLRGDWQLERMTGHETEISDKDHCTTAEFRASADGRTYRITITYLRSYEGSGIVDFSIRPD